MRTTQFSQWMPLAGSPWRDAEVATVVRSFPRKREFQAPAFAGATPPGKVAGATPPKPVHHPSASLSLRAGVAVAKTQDHGISGPAKQARSALAGKLASGLLVFAFCFSLPFVAMAQQTTGTIAGTVRDASGAVIPRVRITVTNEATKLSRTAATDAQGEYRIPFLPIGTYSVRAEEHGFSPQVHTGVTLEILQVRSVDFSLQVGSVTQAITVRGQQAPLLDTQTSESGQVIRGSQIVNLPLNVRQFMQLAFLAPMTIPAAHDYRSTEVNRGTDVPAGAGQRPEDNDYQIDGIDNREAGRNNFAISPPVDSIAEFKVQTGIAPAQFRGGGTTINVVTRGGTNAYHGSAYEYLRNDAADARPFFSNAKAPLKRNQFGGALGGPIVKNKLFIFGNYEGFRQAATGNPPVGQVLTQAERNGDFSSLTTPIVDPATHLQFPGNIIPADSFSPISSAILKLVPLPNNPGSSARNFIFNGQPSALTAYNQLVLRADYDRGTKDTIYGTYLFDQENTGTPPVLPPPTNSGGTNLHLRAQGGTLHWDHIFSPTLVNSFNIGYTRYNNLLSTLNSFKQNFIQEVGILNTFSATDPLFWGAPSISIPGYLMPSEATPNFRTTGIIDGDDSVLWMHGKHSIRMGGELRWTREWMFFSSGNGGTAFDDNFTGNNVADFLLGLPSSVSKEASAPAWNSTVPYVAGYVQDDWRITPKLTLNLGLRYEVEGSLRQSGNCGLDFNAATATMLVSTHCTSLPAIQSFYQNIRPDVKIGTFPQSTPYDADTNNFGPRFGFAYHAFSKTVVRGGYGIFYAAPQIESLASTNQFAPLTLAPIYTSSPTFPTLAYNPEGSVSPEEALRTAPLTIFPFLSRNFPYGQIQQWNFTVEQQITPSLVASAIYQGSHTTNLLLFDNIDARAPGPGNVQSLLPYPQFARIQDEDMWGGARFNGLSFRLEQRSWHGLSYLAEYTYSKSLDNASTLNVGATWTDPFHKQQTSWGPSDFNVPNRFSIAYSYELPVGRGKFLGRNLSGAANKFLDGWGVRGITTFQSGLPQSPSMSLSRVGICAAACSARPDRIGNGNLPKSEQTLNRFFDISAFRLLPPGGVSGRVGNAGRNILIGPGTNNFDFEVFKRTNITENQTLEFDWEMFNAWNHPQFGAPSSNMESPSTFGVITSSSAPRIMQFALRYIF